MEDLVNWQLNVSLIEARQLNVANVNVFLQVQVADFIKIVKSKTKKTNNPYFNELCLFYFHESKDQFLKKYLRISLYSRNKVCLQNRLIGLCDIELSKIWNQQFHSFQNKWMILTDPADDLCSITGYLKCHIQILKEGETSVIPSAREEGFPIEENLIVPISRHHQRKKVLYNISIYRADGIQWIGHEGEPKLKVCKHVYTSVTFAGQTRKTSIARYSTEPIWNESLTFTDTIPSTFETIVVELFDKERGSLGTASLYLSDLIVWEDNNPVPDFGPEFIYLYSKTSGRNGETFSARLLISVTCQFPNLRLSTKLIKLPQPIVPANEMLVAPSYEAYTLFILFYKGLFFKKKYRKNLVYLTLRHGEGFISPNIDEANAIDQKINLKNKVCLGQTETIVGTYSAIRTTDNLIAAQTTNLFPCLEEQELIQNQIESKIMTIESHLMHFLQNYIHKGNGKNYTQLLKSFQNIFDRDASESEAPLIRNKTLLDFKLRTNNILKEIEFILKRKAPIEDIATALPVLIEAIKRNLKGNFPTFPRFEIGLGRHGKIRDSHVLLDPRKYLLGEHKNECGSDCGKMKCIMFKDANHDDLAAVDVQIWFGKQVNLEKALYSILAADDPLSVRLIDQMHTFQLRVHIYQGRIEPGFDASGLADPFVRIFAYEEIRETHVKAQTLDPLWDETVVFDDVTLYGDTNLIKNEPPCIVFEVLDYDGQKKCELVGRSSTQPLVVLSTDQYIPPRLQWVKVYMRGKVTGEILLAMELIELTQAVFNYDLNRSRTVFAIPNQIRPYLKPYYIEILFWGIRNLSYCFRSKIMIIVKCNKNRMESDIIKSKKAANFMCGVRNVEILLPKQVEYLPPLSVELYEISNVKKMTYRASSIVPSITVFTHNEHEIRAKYNQGEKQDSNTIQQELYYNASDAEDWWTIYRNSKTKKQQSKIIEIYDSELESQEKFGGFRDFLTSFQLYTGKINMEKAQTLHQRYVATFKAGLNIKTSPSPSQTFERYPKNDETSVTVRVYIVAASYLADTKLRDKCDPYVVAQLGKTTLSDRKNYIRNDANPVFGKFFEFKANFPTDHTLVIKVMNYDLGSCDKLIGKTSIDVENRFYSKYRASCGLPNVYSLKGSCRWRDCYEPTEILQQISDLNNLPHPVLTEHSLSIGPYCVLRNGGESNEQLCLRVLRNFKSFPIDGYELVPQHVETRSLFHPKKRNIERGKLEMWVDIFRGHGTLPPPEDIGLKKPEKMELRVTIWKTEEVLFADYNILTGERSSDIFVRGWLTSERSAQTTDIHYQSLTGEGYFNWRFIFHFEYSEMEQKMIVQKPSAFSDWGVKEKLPCTLEVWDNDLIFSNDFIGFLNLDLNEMPRGTKTAASCKIDVYDNSTRINLFKVQSARGWWPFKAVDRNNPGKFILAGKIYMELQILSAKQAEMAPAGLGRDPPQPLEKPKRPGSTTHGWMFSPFKMLRFLTFGMSRKKLAIILTCIGIILFFIIGVFSIPGWMEKKLVGG